MNTIRIMYVIGNLHLGGAEKLVSQLASGLNNRPGFSCTVCCLGEGGEYANQLVKQGYPIYILGHKKTTGINSIATAIQIIRQLWTIFVRERVDIVHTYLFYTGILGRIAAKLAGVPKVVHSFFRFFYSAQPWVEKALNAVTDYFVVDSCAVQQLISKRCQIHPDKIQVIHNGIDFEALDREEKRPLRQELGLQKASHVIGIVAHLNPAKGHSLYLNAFVKVLQECPDTWLLIVGDGKLRQQLEEESQLLGVDHRVLFLGYRSDLASILASLDVLVLPSAWEGFGIVQAEAMSLGVPVLGTNTGGAAEVVRAFKTGLLVPYAEVDQLADATILLLKNNALRAQMGQAGQERVRQLFSRDQMLDRYAAFYQGLGGRHS